MYGLAAERGLRHWLSSLAHEGRHAAARIEVRMIEMDQANVDWDADPSFNQCGICFSIGVFDDPGLQSIPLHLLRQKMAALRVVMPMKSDMR